MTIKEIARAAAYDALKEWSTGSTDEQCDTITAFVADAVAVAVLQEMERQLNDRVRVGTKAEQYAYECGRVAGVESSRNFITMELRDLTITAVAPPVIEVLAAGSHVHGSEDGNATAAADTSQRITDTSPKHSMDCKKWKGFHEHMYIDESQDCTCRSVYVKGDG